MTKTVYGKRGMFSYAAVLERVGIQEISHRKFPKMMSGGEQQRAAIARGLAVGGKILLADGSAGNPDTENGRTDKAPEV